jgi:hypothetical protein
MNMRKAPKDPSKWLFSFKHYAPRDFRRLMMGVRASYKPIGKPRESLALITPEVGHEDAVWHICTRLLTLQE